MATTSYALISQQGQQTCPGSNVFGTYFDKGFSAHTTSKNSPCSGNGTSGRAETTPTTGNCKSSPKYATSVRGLYRRKRWTYTILIGLSNINIQFPDIFSQECLSNVEYLFYTNKKKNTNFWITLSQGEITKCYINNTSATFVFIQR